MANKKKDDKKAPGFMIYLTHSDAIGDLTDKEAGQLLKALMKYAADKSEPETENRIVKMVFKMMKHDIDFNDEKYKDICKKRSEAGKKGMAKRWKNNNCYQEITNITNINKNKNQNENINISENINESINQNININKKSSAASGR